jgi:hypothetical protein
VGSLTFHEHPGLALVKHYGVKSLGLPVHAESAFDGNHLRRVVGIEYGAPQKVLAHILFGGSNDPFAAQRVPQSALGVRNKLGVWPYIVLHVAKVM